MRIRPAKTQSSKLRPGEAGVTLLELIIVMCIIGILAAVAVPAIGAYQAVEDAKANTQVVASALREARTLALRTGVQHIVIFNADPGDTEVVARIIQDDDGNRVFTAGETVRNVTMTRVRRAGVNPYGRNDTPFPNATRADNDPTAPSAPLGNGDVRDGSDFPAYFPGGFQAVGFTSRGVTFAVTDPALNPTPDVGSGGGAYYMTDGRGAIFAAVLQPLGEVRVRAYDATNDQWR